MRNIIKVDGLKLFVYLGWTLIERQQLQTVVLTIQISPREKVNATTTDNLADTICYEAIEKALITFNNQTFCLLEHLTYCCYQKIKHLLPAQTGLHLTITKNLGEDRGTRSFTLS